MKVTEHFASEEFAQRAWAKGPAREYPAGWVGDRLTPLCEALEKIRAHFGGKPVRILSGYRSPEFNRAIKGAKQSQHMAGRAADIVIKGVLPKDIYEAVKKNWKAWGIRGVGIYVGFVHVDVRVDESGALPLGLARWRGGRTADQTV